MEKLVLRFKNTFEERQWRDIAFCLSQLPFSSEKSFKKLVELQPLYQDKLSDEFVYKCFCDIINKVYQRDEVESLILGR